MQIKQQVFEITIAALLHDIGKFMQRAEIPLSGRKMEDFLCPTIEGGRYSHQHVLWTNEFFELTKDFPFPFLIKGNDSVANLAAYHHRPSTKMQEIIRLADIIASGTDQQKYNDEDKPDFKEWYKRQRMYPVFEYMGMDDSVQINPIYRYELKPLESTCEACYPKTKENISPAEGMSIVTEYQKLWHDFLKDFQFCRRPNMNAFLISLYSVLEKFTWCIPDSITDRSDISLFDHLKTTAGLASVLYLYHADKIEEADLALNSPSKKTILLVGNLSGIQNYIFNINNVGVGGTAKRLRSRSFKLSVLSDIAAHKLLHAFGLSYVNCILSSGGKFYLMLPNVSNAGMIIEKCRKEFDDWCIANTNAEISVNLAYEAFTCNEIMDFNHALQKVNDMLRINKLRPFSSVLAEAGKWKSESFIFNHFRFKDNETLCKSCGRLPGTKHAEQTVLCRNCADDIQLGRELVASKGIEFFPDGRGDYRVFDCSFSMLNAEKSTESGAYLSRIFNDWNMPESQAPISGKYDAHYVPVFEKNQCEVCTKENCRERDTAQEGNTKFFSCIAQASHGEKSIGILKADADNMGLIFINGFRSEKGKSISRVAALSRLLDIFFTGRVDYLIRSDPGFRNIYTIYSGGDDLVVLGPWDAIIKFAFRLQEEFAKFTCCNKLFSISAGIATSRSRLPIHATVGAADELLDKSKKEVGVGSATKKNQCSILEDCFKWEKSKFLLNEAEKIFNLMDKKNISMAFARLLQSCGDDFLQYKTKGNVANLRFISILAYSIARNIKDSALKEWAYEFTDLSCKKLENLNFITNYAIKLKRS